MHIEIKIVRDSGIEVFSFKMNPQHNLTWYPPPGGELVLENDKNVLFHGLQVYPLISRDNEPTELERVIVKEPTPVRKPGKRAIKLEK